MYNNQLSDHIKQAIRSEKGRKLFLDAAIALVGERLLGNLRTRMVRNGDEGAKNRLKGRYLGVMALFRERGIVVDKSWNGYCF